jgi:hypothetical protein
MCEIIQPYAIFEGEYMSDYEKCTYIHIVRFTGGIESLEMEDSKYTPSTTGRSLCDLKLMK